MLRNGLTPAAIADRIGVDPKTVERWITQDRIPYPKHRHAIAAIVREGESYLWPQALAPERASKVAQSEVVEVYPRRSAVPAELWERLLDQATDQVGILVYGGLFLHEQNPKFVPTLLKKAGAGTKVEIALGDPGSQQVAERGDEEGIGDSMAAKVRNVLPFYEQLRGIDGASVHFHRTTLYNSIYRFDDEILVNTHLYGVPAAHAPLLHLRRLSGGHLFDNYTASFQRVWSRSFSVWPDS
jgi:hypothetical protein